MATSGGPRGYEVVLSEGDLAILTKLLETAAPHWMAIGDALGFLDSELKTISTIPRLVSVGDSGYFRELLSRWLKWAPPNHPLPTIGALVSVLRVVGEERLAFDLPQRFHQRKEPPSKGQKRVQPFSKPSQIPAPVFGGKGQQRSRGQRPMQRGDAQSFDSDAKSEGQQIDTIMRKIDEFEGRFKSLKEAALTEMTNAKVGVKELVMTVTSLPATVMDEHRVFLRENVRELCSANDITAVFVWLNTYWDYLNYTLLQYIVNQYGDPKTQQRMKVYVDDLKQFRRNTSLHLFCKAQPRRHREVPPGFRELVTKHEKSWFDCTLEDVEQFRQDFAWEYDLRQVALMLREMELGSIVITWWIPDSAVSHLRERIQSSSGSEFLTEQGIEEVFIKESPESEGDDKQKTRQITSLYCRTLTEPVKPTKTLQSLMSAMEVSHVMGSSELPTKAPPTHTQPPTETLESPLGPAHGFTLTSQSQQMLTPVRVIGDLHSPWRIAITTSQEIVVTERDRLSFLTMDGQRIRTIDYVETEGHKLELWPRGVTVDEDGAIYVTDLFTYKLHKFSSDGRIVKSVGEYDSEKGQFVCLKSIATRNQKLFVCDAVDYRIQIFDTDLQFISSFDCGQHMYPTDLAIDSSGNIYVSLIHGDYIRVVSKDGTLLRTFDRLPGWVIPQGIHIDHDYVYVTHINGISLFHTNGKFITSFELRMRYPQRITEMSLRGITTDRDGLVYVCDARNNCIIVFPRVL